MKKSILILFSLVLTTMSCKKDENEPTKEQEKVEITDDSQIEIKLKRPENPFLNDFAKTQEKAGEKTSDDNYQIDYPTGETVIVKLENEEATLISYSKNSTKKALTTDENSQNIELVELAIMLPNYVWIGEKDYKVTTIGDGTTNVFDGALSNVTKLIIPEEVKTINTNAFTNCNFIQTFDIKGENKEFKANCFSKPTLEKITIQAKTIDIPTGVTIATSNDYEFVYYLKCGQGYKLIDFIEVSPKGYVFGDNWEYSTNIDGSIGDTQYIHINNEETFDNLTFDIDQEGVNTIHITLNNKANTDITLKLDLTFNSNN